MWFLLYILLILLKALYSYSFTGFVSLNDVVIDKQIDDKNPLALRIQAAVKKPDRFRSRMQNGSNLSGMVAVAYAGYHLSLLLERNTTLLAQYSFLELPLFIVAALVAAIPVLVFGMYFPRQLALQDPMKAVRLSISYVGLLSALAAPISVVIYLLNIILFRLFKIDYDVAKRVTEEEIRMMVDVSRESGNIAISEKEMIENIFELNDKTAAEIMTHRTRIVGLPLDCSLDEAIDLALTQHYSRLPVYNDRLDEIVGILHIKDLLRYLREEDPNLFNIVELCRPPFFTPESKTVDALFKDMQLKHQTMAIIIDEYGGTAGIVTQEDIIEEIVGNLQDEYDEEPQDIILMQDGSYLIQGSATLSDIERAIDSIEFSEYEEENYDTIAGLIIALLDRIPDKMEFPELTHDNFRLKVMAMRERRIEHVRLWILDRTEKN